MSGAPAGRRHLPETQLPGLIDELRPEIEVPGAGASWGDTASRHDLRTDFIARITNADAAVHYDVSWSNLRVGGKLVDRGREDSGRRASPAGVQQAHDALPGNDEVDRDAVRDGDQEHHAGGFGEVSVETLVHRPPGGPVVPADLPAVGLMRQHEAGEARLCAAEGPPPSHHVGHGLGGPEAQIEAAVSGAACGDAGHDAESLAPAGDLIARNRAGERDFPDGAAAGGQSSTRSISAPSARSRSSIRS